MKKASMRTSLTKNHIKDSFLALLKKEDYMDITVASLCREADISRGTFYTYFNNIGQIVDELFDDALVYIGNIPIQHEFPPGKDEKCGMALCGFLRSNSKYQALFFSDALYSRAVDLTVQSLRAGFLEKMHQSSSLPDDLLETLLYYQISGCMAVTKRHSQDTDKDWHRIQDSVDCFLCSGFRNI